jgi:hypothetical protein
MRIRVDPELKRVLNEFADRDDRTEQDEGRHLLRIALGLKRPDGSAEKVPPRAERNEKQVKTELRRVSDFGGVSHGNVHSE